ncbi:hypothetical protein ACGF3J_14785 [Streptomyces sp. NPDC048171]|uniref:hypothetical protein n=1 Tax=Streptomyces sp. NPDC048171 TaxID=3365504 RepID=UPI003720BCA6
MSPAPHAATARAGRAAWLRVLVLLLALVVPCAHATAEAVPTATVTAGAVGEYDQVDSALRAPVRGERRAGPQRPAVRRAAHRARFAPSVPAVPASRARGTRSVVLRC